MQTELSTRSILEPSAAESGFVDCRGQWQSLAPTRPCAWDTTTDQEPDPLGGTP